MWCGMGGELGVCHRSVSCTVLVLHTTTQNTAYGIRVLYRLVRNSMDRPGKSGIGRDPGALRPLRVAADRCEKRFLGGALFGCPLQGW